MSGSPKDGNPYQQGTPEWLLHTNIASKELEARAFAADAERYAAKAADARASADAFRAALSKVTEVSA